MGKNYASIIIDERVENGNPVVVLATKNEREETINIKELHPCIVSDEGQKIINDFDKNAEG